MGAEEIVGLFSAAQDRAPNATILFLNSKIKARRNRTIIKLQELSDDKRSGMIKAAISSDHYCKTGEKEKHPKCI